MQPNENRPSSSRQTNYAYEQLAARIADGRVLRGGQLASERTLAEEIGVSRVTLRRAIDRHKTEGSLRSIQGAGTFVSSPVLREAPNNLLSFSRLAESRGLVATAELLNLEERAATVEEAENCGIAPGSPTAVIQRLRFLDGMPIAISRSLVPLHCAPQLLDADWNTASLYQELSQAGNPPVRADFAIEARLADNSESQHLGLVIGQPVLVTISTSFNAEGRVVEVANIVYRGDRYRFRSSVRA